MFILLTVFSLPTFKKDTVLRTNLEVDTATLKTDNIYLLNENDYLVKTSVFISAKKTSDKVREILNNLIVKNNNKIPTGLKEQFLKIPL